MSLDLTLLRVSINSLKTALELYDKEKTNGSEDLIQTFRARVIQNFEISYELSWKMMRRWLQLYVSSDCVDGIYRRELYRYAIEYRLKDDIQEWMDYNNDRNKISHTYNELIANGVFLFAQKFLHSATILLNRLEEKNG